ncbi:MAG TPA: ABC transporter substrate-binding protein [Acidimicrobiales bacterium]
MRIVSLLPSTTEILFALGAGDHVIGVTFECDYPAEARTRRVVSTSALPEGLTPAQIDAAVSAKMAAGEDIYHLDEGALRELDPELIVTQDLCAVCAVDVSTVGAALAHLGCDGRVLTIDPGRLVEVIDSIGTLGRATDCETRAAELSASLHARLNAVAAAVAGRPRPRVAIVEWTDPLFSAGHWVPDMVTAAGGECVLGAPGEYSGPVTPEQLRDSGAELVVVSPCGYDLAGAHQLANDLLERDILLPGTPVWAVDADAAYVRPGPRLVDGVEALAALCHPGVLPDRPDLAAFVGTMPAATAASR